MQEIRIEKAKRLLDDYKKKELSMMGNFKRWEDVKKEIEEEFTPEELEKMKLEKQIIEATIEARKRK